MSMFFGGNSVQLPFIPARDIPAVDLNPILDQVCDMVITLGTYTVIVGVLLAEGTAEGAKLLKLCGCEGCIRNPGGIIIISDMQILEWKSSEDAHESAVSIEKAIKRERADCRCVYLFASGEDAK